jgi:hypothetical protein
MKLQLKNYKGIQIPKAANPDDAGYDIWATTEPQIVGDFIERPSDRLKLWKRVVYIEYGTNLAWAPQNKVKQVVVNAKIDGNMALCDLVYETKVSQYHIEFSRAPVFQSLI